MKTFHVGRLGTGRAELVVHLDEVIALDIIRRIARHMEDKRRDDLPGDVYLCLPGQWEGADETDACDSDPDPLRYGATHAIRNG